MLNSSHHIIPLYSLLTLLPYPYSPVLLLQKDSFFIGYANQFAARFNVLHFIPECCLFPLRWASPCAHSSNVVSWKNFEEGCDLDGTVQEGRDSSRKGLHGCFTGEQGLYIYDNGTAGRNAIGQICLLPEISAVLNQSDAVCIPLTAAASSILSISIYC